VAKRECGHKIRNVTLNRREFLKRSGLAAGGWWLTGVSNWAYCIRPHGKMVGGRK